MDCLIKILPLINSILIAIGVIIGLYQYSKQQKFKRLQNLDSIWYKFFNTKELLDLFALCDEIENSDAPNTILNIKLRDYSYQDKLKFLALLEEVAIYTEEFEVDRQHANYFFQWHFRFVFSSVVTKTLFWSNIGGEEEINKSYWKKSKDFTDKLPKLS